MTRPEHSVAVENVGNVNAAPREDPLPRTPGSGPPPGQSPRRLFVNVAVQKAVVSRDEWTSGLQLQAASKRGQLRPETLS